MRKSECNPCSMREVGNIRFERMRNIHILRALPHVPRSHLLGSIDKVYFGNDKTDAKNIGFDDSFIYDELKLPRDERKLPCERLLNPEAIRAFEMWMNKTDKIEC